MDKLIRGALLLDFYGELLTAKQRTCCELYFMNDLSLSEIAEQNSITPQGVSDIIRRAESSMESYERRLGLIAKHSALSREREAITGRIGRALDTAIRDPECRALLTEIKAGIDALSL